MFHSDLKMPNKFNNPLGNAKKPKWFFPFLIAWIVFAWMFLPITPSPDDIVTIPLTIVLLGGVENYLIASGIVILITIVLLFIAGSSLRNRAMNTVTKKAGEIF